MKYSQFALAAAFAGIANAQSQCLTVAESIPACALGYITSYAYSSYSCGLVDFGCQCKNFQSIEAGVAGSIGAQPGGCDLGSVLGPAQSLCSCATANSGAGSVTLNAVESACQASAAAIPACALGYLAEAASSIGNCQLNDFACQCSNYNSIENAIVGSVGVHCGGSESAVISSANALCSCVTAHGGGSSGGSGSAAATTTGGSGSGAGATAAPSGTSGADAQSTGGSGAGSGTSPMSAFKGDGATATAFTGLFGLVAGLAAFL